jgi:hypothetical protein
MKEQNSEFVWKDCFFCFCEETIHTIHTGKAEKYAIKAEGIPCDEKVNFIFPEMKIPRQILQAEVDESSNKHFPWVLSHKNDINIFINRP